MSANTDISAPQHDGQLAFLSNSLSSALNRGFSSASPSEKFISKLLWGSMLVSWLCYSNSYVWEGEAVISCKNLTVSVKYNLIPEAFSPTIFR